MGFTNYITKIKDTQSTPVTHDLVDTSASHYVKGTQTASTNVWIGALPDGVTAYYDGLSIDYFLPFAGNSNGATLNLGSKGAKPVYVGNSTTSATTHYPQYSVIHLTYIINSNLNSGNGAWKATGYYDTNTNNAVTQTNTPGSGSGENASFRVLFSGTADDTTRTEGARKTSSLTYNPSSKLLTVDGGAIRAKNGDFDFIKVTDLQANKATIIDILDVQGEMHTNSWTNANIANIGGSFYISPTISNSATSVTISYASSKYSVTVTNTNGFFNSYTLTSDTTVDTTKTYYTKSGNTYTRVSSPSASYLSTYYEMTATPGASWNTNSKVMLTGSVTKDNISYPLGTCTGILSAIGSSGFTVNEISSTSSDIPGNSTTNGALRKIYEEVGGTGFTSEEIKISMYEIGDNTQSSIKKPVGILLTSYGYGSSTYIDILGGTQIKNNVGKVEPNVRIGYLGNGSTDYGLLRLGGNSEYPKGWGIYTENGYFKGTIVASSGKIGDGAAAWTIGNDGDNRAYIWSGISNITTSGSTTGIYVGTNGISNYGSATQYVNLTGGKITAQGADIQGKITASEGVIGGWNLSASALYYSNATPGYSTSNLVIDSTSSTTNSNAIGGSTTGLTWFLSAGRSFGVTKTGVLYATGANISGIVKATSGIIGNNATNKITIGNNTTYASIYSGSHSTLANNTDDGFYIGADGLSIGSNFSVTNEGVLTVSDALLKNVIIYDEDGNKRAAGTAEGFIIYDGTSATTNNELAKFGRDIVLGSQGSQLTVGNINDQYFLLNSQELSYNSVIENKGKIPLFKIQAYKAEVAVNAGFAVTGISETTKTETIIQSTSYTAYEIQYSFSATNITTPTIYAWQYSAYGSGYIKKAAIVRFTFTDTNNVFNNAYSATIEYNGEILVGRNISFGSGAAPFVFSYNNGTVIIWLAADGLVGVDGRFYVPYLDAADRPKIYYSGGDGSVITAGITGAELFAGLNDGDEFSITGAGSKDKFAPDIALGTRLGSTLYQYAVSIGEGITITTNNQIAIGKYNNSSANNLFEIGNGSDLSHSNALTVDWNGNIIAQGMAGQIIMTGCPAGGPGSSTLVPANNTTIYEPIPGWLICNGAAVSRTTYKTLFDVIGTTYGTGNGSTTFNLPDFRGRVGVGGGTSTATGATNHTLNQKAGEETHILTPGETAMKSHDHVIKYNVVDWKNGTGTNKSCRNVVASGSSSASTEDTTAANGSAHNNMQPYIGINYIICTGKTS